MIGLKENVRWAVVLRMCNRAKEESSRLLVRRAPPNRNPVQNVNTNKHNILVALNRLSLKC